MTINELKEVVNKLIENGCGNNEVIISVHDSFSRNGLDATIDMNTEGCLWSGMATNRDTNTTRFFAYLKPSFPENKRAKITFR